MWKLGLILQIIKVNLLSCCSRSVWKSEGRVSPGLNWNQQKYSSLLISLRVPRANWLACLIYGLYCSGDRVFMGHFIWTQNRKILAEFAVVPGLWIFSRQPSTVFKRIKKSYECLKNKMHSSFSFCREKAIWKKSISHFERNTSFQQPGPFKVDHTFSQLAGAFLLNLLSSQRYDWAVPSVARAPPRKSSCWSMSSLISSQPLSAGGLRESGTTLLG